MYSLVCGILRQNDNGEVKARGENGAYRARHLLIGISLLRRKPQF
jgi:hypothetical protein